MTADATRSAELEALAASAAALAGPKGNVLDSAGRTGMACADTLRTLAAAAKAVEEGLKPKGWLYVSKDERKFKTTSPYRQTEAGDEHWTETPLVSLDEATAHVQRETAARDAEILSVHEHYARELDAKQADYAALSDKFNAAWAERDAFKADAEAGREEIARLQKERDYSVRWANRAVDDVKSGIDELEAGQAILAEALSKLSGDAMAYIGEAKRRLDEPLGKDVPVHPVSAYLTGLAISVGKAHAALARHAGTTETGGAKS